MRARGSMPGDRCNQDTYVDQSLGISRVYPPDRQCGTVTRVAELMSFNTDLRPAVEAQLERMTSAPVFRRKPRVRSFLEYTVRQTLDQQHTKLKEYSIAVEV